MAALARGTLFESKAALWALMLMILFPYIANTAGWMAAELGRPARGDSRTDAHQGRRFPPRLGRQHAVHWFYLLAFLTGYLVLDGFDLGAGIIHLYASAFSGFYLSLMMVLWLLILRGCAIEFRNHLNSPVWTPLWDAIFAGSSGLLALLFGTAVTALGLLFPTLAALGFAACEKFSPAHAPT